MSTELTSGGQIQVSFCTVTRPIRTVFEPVPCSTVACSSVHALSSRTARRRRMRTATRNDVASRPLQRMPRIPDPDRLQRDPCAAGFNR